MNAAHDYGAAAQTLTGPVESVAQALDVLHTAGFAIPEAAQAGMRALYALCAAWTYNAAGLPAPDDVKAALGLLAPRGEVTQ